VFNLGGCLFPDGGSIDLRQCEEAKNYTYELRTKFMTNNSGNAQTLIELPANQTDKISLFFKKI
jgi:hypothetical protein